MEIIEPKHKKFCKVSPNLPLPIILKNDNTTYRIRGVYNGFSVDVEKLEDMKNIVLMGYFGKGSFSRSYPQFSTEKSEILRGRQYEKRKNWSEKNPTKDKNSKKVIIVPDSDDEYENYFNNITPLYQIDKSGINEIVSLSLEEAFFLSECVQVLDIYYSAHILKSNELWQVFTESDPFFAYNYVVYYYFKSKNWVVKPGTKFGGDFLLYKQGPSFFHASYVVVLDILNKNHERIKGLSKRPMDNISLLCLNRLCETAGKELMISQVIMDEDFKVNYNNLQNILIKEVLINRYTFND